MKLSWWLLSSCSLTAIVAAAQDCDHGQVAQAVDAINYHHKKRYCSSLLQIPTSTPPAYNAETAGNVHVTTTPQVYAQGINEYKWHNLGYYGAVPSALAEFPSDVLTTACSCALLSPKNNNNPTPPPWTYSPTPTYGGGSSYTPPISSPPSIPPTTPNPVTTQPCTDGGLFAPSGPGVKGFNALHEPIQFTACGGATLDTSKHAVFANGLPLTTTTVTSTGITVPAEAVTSTNELISLYALGSNGRAMFESFNLVFGDISMPVTVVDTSGAPVANAFVQANATTYADVGQSGYTDSNGQIVFNNVPATTISLLARTTGNQISLAGIAATTETTTLILMPFLDTSFASGSGPSLSSVVPAETDYSSSSFALTENYQTETLTDTAYTPMGTDSLGFKRFSKRQENLPFSVATNGNPNLQIASRTITTRTFTKKVFIRYKFITEEVPGGWYGSQYNDYYAIVIRAGDGGMATAFNSMNALGLGAFDAAGATEWMTLELDITQPTNGPPIAVQFDIAVSNVADALFDSAVIVDQFGDEECEDCGNCETCPTDPMCDNSCTTPPLMSCSFYRSCFEAKVPCGPSGYPINYGEKYCHKFSAAISNFTTQGQDWVWKTMNCLQNSLVPLLKPCDGNCETISNAAFASHPGCYVDSGLCDLPPADLLLLTMVVGTDLFNAQGARQGIITAVTCLPTILQRIGSAAAEYAGGVLDTVEREVVDRAVDIVEQFFRDMENGIYSLYGVPNGIPTP